MSFIVMFYSRFKTALDRGNTKKAWDVVDSAIDKGVLNMRIGGPRNRHELYQEWSDKYAKEKAEGAKSSADADRRASDAAAAHRAAAEAAAAARQREQEANQRARDAESARLASMFVSGVSAEPEEKECPDCAETIKFKAKVCKHCGYRFENVEADIEAAKQKAADAANAAIGNGVLTLMKECRSRLELGMKMATAQSGNHGELGVGLCLGYAEQAARQKQMGDLENLPHFELGLKAGDSELSQIRKDVKESATVIVTSRVQGGNRIDPNLDVKNGIWAVYSNDGPVHYSGNNVELQTGDNTFPVARLSGVTVLHTWSKDMPMGQHKREFEMLVPAGEFHLSLYFKDALGNPSEKRTASLNLEPNDVLVMNLDWAIQEKMFSEQVVGYRLRSAQKKSGTTQEHQARWGKRLGEALAKQAAMAHQGAEFQKRNVHLAELEELDVLIPIESDLEEPSGLESFSIPALETGTLPSAAPGEGDAGVGGGKFIKGLKKEFSERTGDNQPEPSSSSESTSASESEEKPEAGESSESKKPETKVPGLGDMTDAYGKAMSDAAGAYGKAMGDAAGALGKMFGGWGKKKK